MLQCNQLNYMYVLVVLNIILYSSLLVILIKIYGVCTIRFIDTSVPCIHNRTSRLFLRTPIPGHTNCPYSCL